MPLYSNPADDQTLLQARAIKALLDDPHLTPGALAATIGASTYRENPGNFMERLIGNGWVMVVVTKEGEAAMKRAMKEAGGA